MNENYGETQGLGGMYQRFNEKSELERFRDRHTERELDRFVDEYEGLWREAFRHNHEDRSVPLHPWKVLKMERRAWAEANEGGWPSMARRHALRVVKDEYVNRWRNLAYD